MDNPLRRRTRWPEVLAAAAALVATLYLAVPSSVFIRPSAVIYDQGYATIKRDLPFGAVTARWSRQMHVSRIGMECHTPDRIEVMRPTPDGTVTYAVGDDVIPCLMQDPPIIATHRWQVLLFGFIPLRPVSFTTTIENRMEQTCRQVRVSTNGQYHVPGSPWYDRVVSPIACYSSPEEAERAGYERAGR